MRILHVIPELADYNGGPPQALATLARAQATAGDDVIVLPCRITTGPQTLPEGRDGKLDVCPGVTRSKLLFYDGRLKRALRDLAHRADIIHIHGTWRYHLLGAAGAAREQGIPFVIRPYGNLGLVTRSQKSFLKWPYFQFIERRVINRAAAIHCCSAKEEQELQGLHLRPRTFVIPLPVEASLTQVMPDEQALARICPIPPAAHVILFLGRIARIKQLDVLVQSFAQIAARQAEWLLILAGPQYEPETAAALQAQIAAAGLTGRILMPGMVRDAAKAALLARTDIFVQPSAHENFGISLAEALLFGKPAVVSTGVAIAGEVDAAGAGIVCEPTAGAIATALETLMMDGMRRDACGAAARRLVKRYSPAAIVAQLRNQYERCLDCAPAK